MNTEPKYLLDTHALIWSIEAPSLLSTPAQKAIESGKFMLSAASLWEMMLKASKADTSVREPGKWWHRYVVQANLPVLAIEHFHIKHLDSLPPIHKDPFDRILICQSMNHGLQLVTKDQNIFQYEGFVSPLW